MRVAVVKNILDANSRIAKENRPSDLEEWRVNTDICAARCSANTAVYHDTIAGENDE